MSNPLIARHNLGPIVKLTCPRKIQCGFFAPALGVALLALFGSISVGIELNHANPEAIAEAASTEPAQDHHAVRR